MVHREVTASSRHERLVLYDPAAIPPETPVDPDLEAQEPIPLAESALAELADRGQALILRIPQDDCQATFRLFVDEPPQAYLRERALQVIEGAVLSIPSGTLKVDGVEFICRLGETRLHSEAESVAVPSGEYEVEVLNLMPWKGRQRGVEIDKRTTKTDRIVGKMVATYAWLGVLFFLANLFVAPAVVVVVLLSVGWRQALTVAGLVLLADVLVVAGFWAIEYVRSWVPALTRAADVHAEFEAENPDVVVCLRRLVDATGKQARGMATLEVGPQ